MKKIIAILLLLAMLGPLFAATCSVDYANKWCPIYSGNLTQYCDNGWSGLAYDKDDNLFYRAFCIGGTYSPFSNSYFSYSWHAAPYTGTVNPWAKVSTCGDEASPDPTSTPSVSLILYESLTATSGTCVGGCTASDYVHLHLKATSGNAPAGENPLYQGNTTNGSGVIFAGNEAMRYGKCTATNSFTGTPCSTTSGPDFYLWGTSDGTASGTQAAIVRGTRQTAGWGPAVAHQGGSAVAIQNGGGEVAGWACYNPALGSNWPFTMSATSIAGTDHDTGVNRAGSWDHPLDTHPNQNQVYDTNTGRIWSAFGQEEANYNQETYSLCVHNAAGAGGGNALSKCGANDLYTATATTPGWQRVSGPGTNPAYPLYDFTNPNANPLQAQQWVGTLENTTTIDTYNDVLVAFGGLNSNYSTADHSILIFCKSATSTGYGCTSGNAGTWIHLYPGSGAQCGTAGFYCGDIGDRDGSKAAFDSVNHRALLFGGYWAGGSKGFMNTVVYFDAHTGNVCLSDTSTQKLGFAEGSNSTATGACTFVSYAAGGKVNGTPPPEQNASSVWNANLKFPAWDYDSGIAKFVFYGGNGNGTKASNGSDNQDDPTIMGVWLFDSSTNTWSQPAYAPSPAGDATWPVIPSYSSHTAMAYDSVDGGMVWLNGSPSQLWQLPDTALGGSAPSTFTLTLTVAGTGTGSVTDTNSGFSCASGTCSHSYTSGASISLSDTTSGGSTFAGWSASSGSAGCSGTTVPCTFSITANSATTGTFNPPAATMQSTTLREGTTIKK